jgi:hypothetical protein
MIIPTIAVALGAVTLHTRLNSETFGDQPTRLIVSNTIDEISRLRCNTWHQNVVQVDNSSSLKRLHCKIHQLTYCVYGAALQIDSLDGSYTLRLSTFLDSSTGGFVGWIRPHH